MQSCLARLFPIPFLVAGLALVFFGLRDVARATASEDWPTAAGTVLLSSVEYETDSDGGGTYRAEVLYEFDVGGTTYSSNRIEFGTVQTNNPSGAQVTVNRYPVGEQVLVHYDPDDPFLAVLEPGIQAGVWFMPGLGAIFAVVGALMLVFLPRAMRRQAARDALDEDDYAEV